MTTHPRTVSLLLARSGLGVLLLGFTLVGVWTANDSWGQAPSQKKPRVEEEEDTPKTPPKNKPRREDTEPAKTQPKKNPRVEEEEDTRKRPPKRKVIRVEEEDDPKGKPGTNPPAAPTGDLTQLAEQARHPGIRQLFRDLSVPHDHVVYKKTDRVTINQRSPQKQDDVEPIAAYLGMEPANYPKGLTLRTLAGKPLGRSLASIQYVQPYETIAQERVRTFLQKEPWDRVPQHKDYLSRFDMLAAAEQALSAVLRWHESARQTGQREGEEWMSIESSLRKQLLDDILLKQLELLAEAKDWERVLALTRRLALSYASNTDRERIARPVADMIKATLDNPTSSEERRQEARKRLHDLEMEFPDNRIFRPLSDSLREQAASLLKQAKELHKDKDKMGQVRELLHRAEETWPQLPGLHAFKLEMSRKHPVLRVGVRGPLPKHLSPAWACTDTERRVVEMLFESLMKLTADESGIFRYRPGLAEGRPKVVPLGRQFQLPRNATWSNGHRLDSGDIRFTVGLLKDGVGGGRSSAWGELLDKVEVTGDPFRMTLRLKQGYVDPLSLMTFKVLPRDQPMAVNSEKFAENPVSSGPYFLDRSRQSDEEQRQCLFFIANPSYGVRSGKRDLPRIQEIRFYVYNNPVEELLHSKLDLVLDLTADEADKLRQQADRSRMTIPLPSPTTPNRRIYFLAINQSKVPNADVRKALAYAINREQLLDKHFRGPLKRQIHKALNGPYPAGSWACNAALTNRQEKDSLDLFDADKARGLSQQPSVKQVAEQGPLRLKYAEGDPALMEALKELCTQVKGTTGIVVELVPCDPCRLREDVEQTQSYELAYYHYDFPDETYWLWPLLGQSAETRNYLKFTDDAIQLSLRQAMGYRDFAKMQECLRGIHRPLMEKMPLIPLWQLDPLLAHNQDIKPIVLDPILVFTNIEEWRLQ